MAKQKIKLSFGGCEAILSTQGASFQKFTVGKEDILYPETVIEINGQKKKRGGIPILFPWAGALENYPQHGFARDLGWKKLSIHRDLVKRKTLLELKPNKETLKIFPYHFCCRLGVELNKKEIFCHLIVFNEDKKPMPIAPGFHPYFKIPKKSFKNLKTNIPDFDPESYELGKTLFFPLQPVELLVPELGKIKIIYGKDFNRKLAKLVVWSDKSDYFCAEAWSAPLEGFLKEKERMIVSPGKKAEFSLKIQAFLE